MKRMRKGPLRIIEVVTDTGHVAGKFTEARKIEIRPQGGLVISGRTYTSTDLLRHLGSLIERIDVILDTWRLSKDPLTVRFAADGNRRELARRINALQSEIRDNGYSTAQAAEVVVSLRCRLDDWFEPYDRLPAPSRRAQKSRLASSTI